MSIDMGAIKAVRKEADCLFTKAEIDAAIKKIATEITNDLADKNPIVFCVMNGGLIFAGQLLPLLDFPLEISYLHATRYKKETTGGELFWKAKPEVSFIDRDIIIIDDILDEGNTLAAIIQYCQHAGANAVYTTVLLDKEHDRKAIPGFSANYTGLTCPDRFVFGFGMDYKGYWRNAPGIFAVKGL
ncbi:hypoxanthine-guanine phosphoribosyltransferase [Entomomonas moraniae]|uniref:Hypoxanthine-guanine phosphoribosyltransferase n=1 Tax=Entomomonas moraniae TaxID=2213226 RepID=A0A3Q9JLN6_9GAMM|nr:hypoxanthine-guanine phosphoribosyltransferase [Entomomonas moraniae]AZS50543.1 hypoxanthine-guanine phosphoribosyltransferase [Entomomonas moraniae]